MAAIFVIFLREGLEAGIIVAVLATYLERIGQRRYFRDLVWGVGAALVLVVGGGVGAYLLVHQYDGSRAQTIFELCTYCVAAVVLTYVTFWMKAHGRTIGAELERRGSEALSRRTRFGLGVVAFTAVGREGLETMVFTLAIIFSSSAQAPAQLVGRGLLVGAGAGLVVALALTYSVFALGRQINLKLFFGVIGAVLLVFGAGLVVDVVGSLQQLGWLSGGGTLWDSSGMLSVGSSLGDVAHSLVGYTDKPSTVQVAAWVGYLAVCGPLYLTKRNLIKRSSGSGGQIGKEQHLEELGGHQGGEVISGPEGGQGGQDGDAGAE
jgi:high-affinity iron transporter